MIDPQGTYGVTGAGLRRAEQLPRRRQHQPDRSGGGDQRDEHRDDHRDRDGVGAITVGRYASNPDGAPTFGAAGSYFDVSASSPTASPARASTTAT